MMIINGINLRIRRWKLLFLSYFTIPSVQISVQLYLTEILLVDYEMAAVLPSLHPNKVLSLVVRI